MESFVDNTATSVVAEIEKSATETHRRASNHVQLNHSRTRTSGKRRLRPLQNWRLSRVLRFVDQHLEEHITLASMANAAGLTRMHFAAQFRLAAGVRPHEYLLRRRIWKACELLSRTRLSIVQVALIVGFQTQAHFTTVFKRLVGAPPLRWRRSKWNELAVEAITDRNSRSLEQCDFRWSD
jgi:transcriptional regulator GlxA family with amidase domain